MNTIYEYWNRIPLAVFYVISQETGDKLITSSSRLETAYEERDLVYLWKVLRALLLIQYAFEAKEDKHKEAIDQITIAIRERVNDTILRMEIQGIFKDRQLT